MFQKVFLRLTKKIQMERQTLNSGISGTGHFLKSRLLVVWVCLLVAGLWLLAHVALTNAAPLLAPDATVSLSPSTQVVDLGEHFTVDVMIDEYSDLGGYEFNLLFDSSVVQGEEAEDGGLLESSGRTIVGPLVAVDNSNPAGKVAVGAVAYGNPAGASGTDEKLATVQLKAVGLHNTALDLDGIQIVDTQGTPQSLLPPVGGTVLVNTALDGKFREWCKPIGFQRINMDPDENNDPPGLGTVDCRDDTQVHTGYYSFKITGSPSEKKQLKQNRAVDGEAGETFKLSGRSFVTSDPGTDLGSGAYRLAVAVFYTDGTPQETFWTDFSKAEGDWNDWQYREVQFTTAAPYRKFRVLVQFFKKPETAIAWFDDIQLVRQSP